jgi:hypothetical protein
MNKILADLKKNGSTKNSRDIMLDFNDFNELVELSKFMNMEEKYKS